MIDLTGGNPHRSRALGNAGRTLERIDERVVDLLEQGTLTSIRGIGDRLANQIQEIVDTGTFEAREELLGAIPAGVLDIMRVKGLGAKKARAIWQQLNIISLTELEHAAASGQLASLDGFGQKTQDNILKNIVLLKSYSSKGRYADVLSMLASPLEALKTAPGIDQVWITGELRRKMETIEHVELVVQSSSPPDVQKACETVWNPTEPFSRDDARIQGTLPNGIPITVHITGAANAGTVLWKTTGSPAHCEAFEDAHGPAADVQDEGVLYEKANLPHIPPELREHTGELELTELPALITTSDLNGTLHNHSTYSDGAHTLQQMADRSREMGLSYFGICDHSRSLVVANGLSIERVQQQQDEIKALNASYAEAQGQPFKIFSGIESDILADGSLDYPDDVLHTFDFVVASVHTRMNMAVDEATSRLIKAIENPYTRILGHPTGRILLVREGYPIDYERVLDACAAHGVAIELNANPYRLDLDWRWIRTATEKGILISINPDAHAMDGLYDVQWGVEVARKGWLTAEQCLNALSLDAFEQWVANR